MPISLNKTIAERYDSRSLGNSGIGIITGDFGITSTGRGNSKSVWGSDVG